MLEDEVDEKFYLSLEQMGKIVNWKAHQKPFEHVNGDNSIVQTLTARGAGEYHSGMITYSPECTETTNLQSQVREVTKKGYAEAIDNTIDVEKIKQVGQLYPNSGNPQAGRVYDADGISPTMDTCSGGNRMPKVAVAMRGRYNDEGELEQQLEISDREYANSITTVQKDSLVGEEQKILVKQATKKGYAEAVEGDSVNIGQPNSRTRRGRVGKQISQTLTTSGGNEMAVVVDD